MAQHVEEKECPVRRDLPTAPMDVRVPAVVASADHGVEVVAPIGGCRSLLLHWMTQADHHECKLGRLRSLPQTLGTASAASSRLWCSLWLIGAVRCCHRLHRRVRWQDEEKEVGLIVLAPDLGQQPIFEQSTF